MQQGSSFVKTLKNGLGQTCTCLCSTVLPRHRFKCSEIRFSFYEEFWDLTVPPLMNVDDRN